MRLILAFLLALLDPAAAEPAYAPPMTPGGTEIRNLVPHAGGLFAANGYWKYTGAAPGAQILVLDGPGRTWRVEHSFDDLTRGGRRQHLAMSALAEATFRTDAAGRPLPTPVQLLLASTWDITGRRSVFARDAATGTWSAATLAEGRPNPPFLPQIRALATHRDAITGADLAVAGDSTAIFAGPYEPNLPGHIRWTPELATQPQPYPGLEGRLRVSSFAELQGRLYAAIGQQVWLRRDGPAPQWQPIYANPTPRYSQTGLRGLTAVTDPGRPPALLAAIEGNQARIVRIDPATGAETTELDLGAFLDAAWSTRVSYVIAAYNDMTRLPTPAGDDLLIGLEAFIPPASPRPPGHTLLDIHNGLEAGAWFLIRHPGARYDLHQVTAVPQGVAVRTAAPSPFPAERGALYLGGYDANDAPADATGWITRATIP